MLAPHSGASKAVREGQFKADFYRWCTFMFNYYSVFVQIGHAASIFYVKYFQNLMYTYLFPPIFKEYLLLFLVASKHIVNITLQVELDGVL